LEPRKLEGLSPSSRRPWGVGGGCFGLFGSAYFGCDQFSGLPPNMRQRRYAWHAKPNLAARKNALYGMARAWEALAKYIEHHEEARAEANKDADWCSQARGRDRLRL